MRCRIVLAGALLAALATAPAAYAQGAVVQAVDGTQADPLFFHWSPKDVTIKAGETVTWNFTGTNAPHNVIISQGAWSYKSGPFASAPPPAQYTFTTPDVYTFVCEVHATTMTGTVTVTDAAGTPPPPPPPPPLSEQRWQNEQQPPTVLELADGLRPRLSRVRAVAVRNGARLRFRLDERARVTARFKLGGLTVKTVRATFQAGTRSLIVRDPRMRGRYRIALRARDLSGNRSRVKQLAVTVG